MKPCYPVVLAVAPVVVVHHLAAVHPAPAVRLRTAAVQVAHPHQAVILAVRLLVPVPHQAVVPAVHLLVLVRRLVAPVVVAVPAAAVPHVLVAPALPAHVHLVAAVLLAIQVRPCKPLPTLIPGGR